MLTVYIYILYICRMASGRAVSVGTEEAILLLNQNMKK